MRGDGRVFLPKNTSNYHVAFCVNGKERRESAGTSDEQAAWKYLRNRLKEVHATEVVGVPFVSSVARKFTVGDLIQGLRDDYTLRGILSPKNKSTLDRADRDFGNIRAVALTSTFVDQYIQKRLGAGDAKATINRTLEHVRGAFRLAMKQNRLAQVPYIRHLNEKGNERQGFFSDAQLRAVVAELPKDLQDFVLFGYLTGWRKKEISTLTWNDIEGDLIRLRGEHSKNGEPNNLPIEGELAEIIERRRQARMHKDVLVNTVFHRKGRPVSEFRKSWASACLHAGVSGRLFHDLRRTAARDLVRSGVPETVAMTITGHKTRSVFDRYNITKDDDKREALRKVSAYRKDAPNKVVKFG